MSQGLKRASTSDPDEGSHEAEDDHEQLDSVHKRQTKNKLAQARYRQRQRQKMETLDVEVVKLRDAVAQLQAALERSEAENCQLRSAVNSKVCDKCAAVGPQQAVAIKPQPSETGKAAAPAEGGVTSNEWIVAMAAHVKGVLSRVRPGNVTELDGHKPREWYLCYRTYVTEIAKLLRAADDTSPENEALQHQAACRLDAILTERRGVMTRFYEGITRKSLEHKNAIRSQPIIMFGSPPPAMWTKVVGPLAAKDVYLQAAASLSSAQRQAILRHRGPYLAQLESSSHRRRNIVADLSCGEKGQPSLIVASDALLACRALEDNILEDQAISFRFMRALQVVVSPTQEARMIVASFPYFMEVQPVVNALAVEAVGDLSVLGDNESASDAPAVAEQRPSGLQPPSSSSTGSLFSGFQLPASPFTQAYSGLQPSAFQQPGHARHPPPPQQHQQQDFSIRPLHLGNGLEPSRLSAPESTEALSLPRLSDLMNLEQDTLPDISLITENAWACAIPEVPMHHL